MKTTADYIDALRVHFNVDSDFSAMSRIGVKHRQQVSQWRKLHGAFGEELSIKIADTLDLDRAEVLLNMQIQKEKNVVIKKIWERIATTASGIAAALSIIAILPSVDLADPSPAFVQVSQECILCQIVTGNILAVFSITCASIIGFILYFAYNPRPRKE